MRILAGPTPTPTRIDGRRTPRPENQSNPGAGNWNCPLLRLGDDGMPDGQTVVLQASAKSVRAQVGKLVNDYTTTLKRQYVTLIVESSSDNKYVPEISITGHSDDQSDLLEFDGGFDGDRHGTNSGNAGSGDNISTGSAPKKNDDMDDDIPF